MDHCRVFNAAARDSATRQRETGRGGPSGRTHEIQRLIGRSLRAAADMKILGERTITLDCDVLQADGGTRTAAITGAYVAFALASKRLLRLARFKEVLSPTKWRRSASVLLTTRPAGFEIRRGLKAEVDMNVVCTGDGRFIEVQGTAEREPFTREQMDKLLDLATKGIEYLVEIQRETLARSNHG